MESGNVLSWNVCLCIKIQNNLINLGVLPCGSVFQVIAVLPCGERWREPFVSVLVERECEDLRDDEGSRLKCRRIALSIGRDDVKPAPLSAGSRMASWVI